MRSPCVCFWQTTSKKGRDEWVKVQQELREEAHSYAGLHTWRVSIGEYNVACNLIGRNSAKAVGRERERERSKMACFKMRNLTTSHYNQICSIPIFCIKTITTTRIGILTTSFFSQQSFGFVLRDKRERVWGEGLSYLLLGCCFSQHALPSVSFALLLLMMMIIR